MVRDYNNKNDCKRAFHLTKLPGNTKIKRTVETNTNREYHNQKDCIVVLQTKVLPGSFKKQKALVKFGLMLNVPVNNFSDMLGRSHHFLGFTSTFGGEYVLLKDTIRRPEKRTVREYNRHIKRSIRENNIKSIASEYHNPKYCQEVPQTKDLTVNAIMKGISRSIIIKNSK